jgi:hypothetical protein
MSARKRHTEALDFMRTFMVSELGGPWGLGGAGHRDMIDKLVKRGYWQAPKEWAGQDSWVHEVWERTGHGGEELFLEAAQPGIHIYEARCMKPPYTVICERTDKPDAKPGYRNAAHKAWAARNPHPLRSPSDAE